MDPDHLRTQRKGAIIPSGLLATYTHSKQPGEQQFGDSPEAFENELEEWLELQEDIPLVLQDSVTAILGRRMLPEQVVASKANDFFAQAYSHLENINRNVISGQTPDPNQEHLLGIYCKLFFILVVEYGNELALTKLIQMWDQLEERSVVWSEAIGFIRFILSEHIYPLSCHAGRATKEDVSRYLSMKAKSLISHTVRPDKASRIGVIS